ncbi:LOW QUALITY PROTEIN: uncharacterized protein rfx5 [Aplochiton taeniatus]
MSEDNQRVDPSKREGLDPGEGDATEPSMLMQKLKNNVSKSVQEKVDKILQDVKGLSDNDKLYLYLQLPSGPSPAEKSGGVGGGGGGGGGDSFNTADQLHTCNWIRSHLEEHSDTCLPKQDVYETYRRHCEDLQHRPLSAANFGKIIRDIFPNIKARRLGGRGQSKYCYSGIRRKTVLNMPLLPNLDLKNDPSELTELVQTYKQEVTEAACELICDWAQKILKRSFDTVVEIARFLVQEHIVNPRCSHAELVTSAALAGGPAKPYKVIKKTPGSSKGGESEGSSTDKREKDSGDTTAETPHPADNNKPSTNKSSSSSECPPPSSSLRPPVDRDLQVEKFMKNLPRILPRSSVPEHAQLSVRSSPPKEAAVGGAGGPGGGVKVIMAALSQQQGGAVPLVILPRSCLSYPDPDGKAPPPPSAVSLGAPTSVVQRARTTTKRPPEPHGAAGGTPSTLTAGPPAKRKRGRPRKPRPEDSLPPPPPPQPPPLPASIITPGGVIHKASSSSTSSSQMVEMVVFQDQSGLVLTSPADPDRPSQQDQVQTEPRPLILIQSPGWELGPGSRAVIQRAPRPNNNNNLALSPSPLQPQHHLPLPTLHEERGEVEITLTPVEPHLMGLQISPDSSPPQPPPASSSSSSSSNQSLNAEGGSQIKGGP